MNRLHVIAAAVLGIASGFPGVAAESGKAIDTERSSITIHVGKAGIFSAAAHEHWVTAPIVSGTLDDAGAAPGVRFVVDASKVSVKPDTRVSDKDQAEVQSNMQNKVLESSAYPKIIFQSTDVQRTGDHAWKVSGDLTLHGATKPVIVDVRRENDAYVGMARIRQTDFGIQPIKIAGGVVKVKNDLEIQFQVYTTSR